VSSSTQNQARSAILFLYKEVLGSELPWLANVKQARKTPPLPVVLTEDEAHVLVAQVIGVPWLIGSLLYGVQWT
jgi:hypothetical protein